MKMAEVDIHATLRQKQLMDVKVTPEYIDHYYREPSNRRDDDGIPVPDRVFIERYMVEGGAYQLQLVRIIEGKHTPGFYTNETFTFDDVEDIKGTDYV